MARATKRWTVTSRGSSSWATTWPPNHPWKATSRAVAAAGDQDVGPAAVHDPGGDQDGHDQQAHDHAE